MFKMLVAGGAFDPLASRLEEPCAKESSTDCYAASSHLDGLLAAAVFRGRTRLCNGRSGGLAAAARQPRVASVAMGDVFAVFRRALSRRGWVAALARLTLTRPLQYKIIRAN
jgi:hypothetical protein